MGDGFTVQVEALRLAATQLDSAAAQVEPTAAEIEAASQSAIASNAEYLTSQALEEFVNAFTQATTKLAQKLSAQATGLGDNAQAYQTTEEGAHSMFRAA
jgi:hypothetical protein